MFISAEFIIFSQLIFSERNNEMPICIKNSMESSSIVEIIKESCEQKAQEPLYSLYHPQGNTPRFHLSPCSDVSSPHLYLVTNLISLRGIWGVKPNK